MNKIIVSNVTIGCDPEMFLRNKNDGQFISAVGLIGGSKEVPRMVCNDTYGLQEDNVAVEFTIPPCKAKGEFTYHLDTVVNFIRQSCIHSNLELAILPSAVFDSKQLKTPQAQAFGCDPDFNAWLMSINDKPEAENPNLRSCGGHIHIGYDSPSEEVNIKLIKAMDLFLGVPSILIDNDTRRRELYGKAGCYRDKFYGVEYRTVSNFWLASKELQEFIWDNTMLAIDFVNHGNEFTPDDEYNIQACINNGDKELACKIIEKFKIPFFQKIEEYATA